jgi:hypothetical protein
VLPRLKAANEAAVKEGGAAKKPVAKEDRDKEGFRR